MPKSLRLIAPAALAALAFAAAPASARLDVPAGPVRGASSSAVARAKALSCSGAARRTCGTRAIWTSTDELRRAPASGPAWKAMKKAADRLSGVSDLSDQNSNHDVATLAAAFVYARTGRTSYRAEVRRSVADAIGSERGGRTLALGRNLASYVIAADVIGLRGYDAALDARFRRWLRKVRNERLGGKTLITTQQQRPNNWGLMAGASRVALDRYLGDDADVDRAATLFHAYLGDRRANRHFRFGDDSSWQPRASAPVGIVSAGSSREGLDLDGVMPDDMRRGCDFRIPPCHTGYLWEGLQGAFTQARLLARAGYDAFEWQDRALLRAVQFIDRIDKQFGDWWATSDDEWQIWLINDAYATNYPTVSPAGAGKIMGWTDWLFASTGRGR